MDPEVSLGVTQAAWWEGIEKRPLLILAHPGSGTRFVQDRFEALGLKVGHERINPNRQYDIVLSCFYWNLHEWGSVFGLVREPIRTVYSAAKVFVNGGTQRFMEEVGAPPSTGDTLHDMLLSVTTVYERIHEDARRVYRLEDVSTSYIENYTHHPDPPDWKRLYELNPERAEMLKVEHVRWGYNSSLPSGSD